MLAETTTDFPWQWVGWLFVGLACVAVCMNQIDDFFDRRKSKPGQPPNEQLQASHNGLENRVGKVEGYVEELRHEHKADNAERDKVASIQRASLYRKIEEVRVEMAGQNEDIRKELSADIKALPNEIITTLKNTGAI